MSRFASFVVALGLATGGSTAFANSQPVQMTDEQMDNVAGGLITIVAVDLITIKDVEVAVPVQAQIPVNAAVAVLGAAQGTQFGNLSQSQRGRQ